MKNYIFIIFLLIPDNIIFSQEVPDSVKFRSLEPYYFNLQYLKENPALLIDVREFFEYRRSRIKDAVNIPSSGNLEAVSDTINKEKALFFYCYSGTRSKKAARFFYDKGFRKLYSLEGGIVKWQKEKLGVDKSKRYKHKKT
jgi:rhodanese-related sulfurtransferase